MAQKKQETHIKTTSKLSNSGSTKHTSSTTSPRKTTLGPNCVTPWTSSTPSENHSTAGCKRLTIMAVSICTTTCRGCVSIIRTAFKRHPTNGHLSDSVNKYLSLIHVEGSGIRRPRTTRIRKTIIKWAQYTLQTYRCMKTQDTVCRKYIP